MKNIYAVIITILMSATSLLAQSDFVPKTDGTKYYILVYDGGENKKVLSLNKSAGWDSQITTSAFFDGSSTQLWVFENVAAKPGYLKVRNTSNSSTKMFLMSWNWKAYLEDEVGGKAGNDEKDYEFWFRFSHVFDGWQSLITHEKEAGHNGIAYTPGADALNIGTNNIATFNVKFSTITQANAASKVFKLVEFDPMKLFEETVTRGQNLYDQNPTAPSAARYNLFVALEKARAVRVFGTDAQILSTQTKVDGSIKNFSDILQFATNVTKAKTFIDTVAVPSDVKTSFNAIITKAETLLNADSVNYSGIPAITNQMNGATSLVTKISSAIRFTATLTDPDLVTGMNIHIDKSKAILANIDATTTQYSDAVTEIQKTIDLVNSVLSARALIAKTEDFDDAKADLNKAISASVTVLKNTASVTADLTLSFTSLQSAVTAFNLALEAGDTQVELINPGFESAFTNWKSFTNVSFLPYTENKGVSGSKNMTVWNSSNYNFIILQSLKGLPSGTYELSVMAQVSADNGFSLFAISGKDTMKLAIGRLDGTLSKRKFQISVKNDSIQFGIKGAGSGNTIPGNVWGVFDNFELKWMSKATIVNPGFESAFTGWTSNTDTNWLPYTDNNGVSGSKSMTVWNSVDYTFKNAQTINNLPDGQYQLSVMASTSNDNAMTLYAESGSTFDLPLVKGDGTLFKRKLVLTVTGGSVTIGVKGSGTGNKILANQWGRFDNFELVRLPNINIVNPGFENSFTGWTKVSDVSGVPYIESKGVNGSKNMTVWNGADYHFLISQNLTNVFNGTYELSVMSVNSNNNALTLFGKSAGKTDSLQLVNNGWSLSKYKTNVKAIDKNLEIGVRGTQAGNFIPANNWGTFDNFELKMKSVKPEYYEITAAPVMKQGSEQEQATEKLQQQNVISWWQNSDLLILQSGQVMKRVALYTITGAKIADVQPEDNYASFSVNSGVYIVKILNVNGETDVIKVVMK